MQPVEGVAGGPAVQLQERAHHLAAALPPPLRVGEAPVAPPVLGAHEHPGMPRGRRPLDPRERLDCLVLVEQADPACRLELTPERDAVAGDLDVAAEGGDAIAEPAVEGVLGSPEVRHRLAALADVVELRAHQLPEDPAAAVRGQDSHQRHAGRPDQPAGDPGLEREDPAAADDLPVLERRVDALCGEDPAVALGEVGLGLAAPEVVEDRLDHARELVRPGRPDLEAQMRSSGA